MKNVRFSYQKGEDVLNIDRLVIPQLPAGHETKLGRFFAGMSIYEGRISQDFNF
ncbi:hypothetical protein [Bacillus xiapuensis]|uniref:hypothetical protein n=1 Tax=Bacillus xiapuensis TaxID=2014075 RepID=UPI0012FD1FBD|nr:hypothetical protein [Bacillus xiapuensis]